MIPFHTQEFENFIQYWFELDVNEYSIYKDTNKGHSEKTTKRVFAITHSLNLKKSCKHPFLLNLDFNIAGKAQGWGAKKNVKVKGKEVDKYTSYAGYGGIIEKDKSTEYLYDGANLVGFRYLQNFYREVLNQETIIVSLSMVSDDSYYYAECNNMPEDYLLDYNNLCWYTASDNPPNRDNPDLDFLKHLFDIIYDSKLYDLLKFDFDYSKMSVFGYSVGAQAVSRYINNFPLSRTKNNHKFPDIISAVMLAGGSYECYNDALYNTKMFSSCTKEKQNKNGCCPENFTEKNYMDSTLSWKNHPPVICVQQLNDFYADPKASVYYIAELKKHKVPCVRLTSYGYQHGFANNDQAKKSSEFIHKYLFEKKEDFVNNLGKKNNTLFIICLVLIITTIYITCKTGSKEGIIVLLPLFVLLFAFAKKNNGNNHEEGPGPSPAPFTNIPIKEQFVSFPMNKEDFLIKENFGKKKNEKKKNEENNNGENNNEKCKEYTKKDIVDLYNNKGLLVTMNSTKLYCPQFVEQLMKYDENGKLVSNCPFGQKDINCKCVKSEECEIFDIGDLRELLKYNFDDAKTMCYALDTTLIQLNLMPLVFGPYLDYNGMGESFQIGVLLDYNKIKDYVACAYSFDGGSIARTPPQALAYNVYDKDTAKKCKEEAKKITDDDIKNGKIHNYKSGVVSNQFCPATVMAGCINFDGEYKPQVKEFDVRDSKNYEIEKCPDMPDEWCFTPNAFSDSLTNPFYKGNSDGIDLFLKQTKKVQNILGKQARPLASELNIYNNKNKKDYDKTNPKKVYGDYFAYQIPEETKYPQEKNKNSKKNIGWGSNGYRENEIDLFIPQKDTADVDNGKCEPTDKIKEIWENAIIGVFTNNVCFGDIKYNNIENNYPEIVKNCCNPKFNEDLVLEIVKKYNSKNGPNRNKIHGYIIETFKPDERIESAVDEYPLNIRQIMEE